MIRSRVVVVRGKFIVVSMKRREVDILGPEGHVGRRLIHQKSILLLVAVVFAHGIV